MRPVAAALVAVAATLPLTACGGGTTRSDSPSNPRRTVAVDLAAQGSSPGNSFSLVDLYTDDGVVTGVLLAGPEAVWPELTAVYEELGIGSGDLNVFDPAARRIGVAEYRTRRIAGHRPSRYLRCGTALGAPKADNGQVRLTLESWVGADERETTVSTLVSAWTRDQGTSAGPVVCRSNGALEREIVERVQLRLLRDGG